MSKRRAHLTYLRGLPSKALTLALFLLLFCKPGHAYSFQSHEQIIDLAWKQSIRPLLLKRYPSLTKAQIDEAHAYAYGGCAIQTSAIIPSATLS